MIEKGKPFPAFNLADQQAITRNLDDYKGSWLVIFFYPKDNTPACTSEVAAFAEYLSDFQAAGAQIIGISGDTVGSHKKFAEKLNISYQLLSDPGRSFTDSCGLLKDKKVYGKPVRGVIRSTFLLDPKGIVQESWLEVKVPEHAQAVLAALKTLSAN